MSWCPQMPLRRPMQCNASCYHTRIRTASFTHPITYITSIKPYTEGKNGRIRTRAFGYGRVDFGGPSLSSPLLWLALPSIVHTLHLLVFLLHCLLHLEVKLSLFLQSLQLHVSDYAC